MAKQSGMGDNCYVDGFDVSGDIGSLPRVSGSLSTQDITNITQSANARLGLLRDGGIDYGAYWNPGPEANAAHLVHRTLPTLDRAVTYVRGAALGAPAASLIGKQVNYDGSRGADGSFTLTVNALANGFGLEWGNMLTPGKLTQGAAANGATVDLGALPISWSFGWAAYLHVFAFTGTSVTVKVQDSADGVSFADLAGAGFVAASGAGAQRITAGPTSTATVRRYARVVTTGTFTNVVLAVNFVRYEAAGHA